MTAALKHLLAVAVLAVALVPALCGADVACVMHGDTPFPGAVMSQARSVAPAIRVDADSVTPTAQSWASATMAQELTGPVAVAHRPHMDDLTVSLRV